MENKTRLIDADALFKAIKSDKVAWRFGVPNTLGLLFDHLRVIIKLQPTVDAVEVVRCKDCKQWSRNSGIAESPNGHCFCHDIETNGHDFCSYGERREGE